MAIKVSSLDCLFLDESCGMNCPLVDNAGSFSKIKPVGVVDQVLHQISFVEPEVTHSNLQLFCLLRRHNLGLTVFISLGHWRGKGFSIFNAFPSLKHFVDMVFMLLPHVLELLVPFESSVLLAIFQLNREWQALVLRAEYRSDVPHTCLLAVQSMSSLRQVHRAHKLIDYLLFVVELSFLR
jgi:hypothetical protein